MLALNLHAFAAQSRANGPGVRAVVWFQGCTLGCKGCFNPQTHWTGAGKWQSVDAMADTIVDLAPGIEGVTISGGEPFQQSAALCRLLGLIRRRSSLSVLVFSGYRHGEGAWICYPAPY